MPTLIEYADIVAGSDTGRWRAAVDRAAVLAAGWHWTIGQGTFPDQEVPFRALALLVYALAGRGQVDPADIEPADLARWFAEHPESGLLADDPGPSRIDVLEAMLAEAGHDLPTRVVRDEAIRRPRTGDRAADVWADMTILYSGDPDPYDILGSSGPWPDPVLPIGLNSVEHRFGSSRNGDRNSPAV